MTTTREFVPGFSRSTPLFRLPKEGPVPRAPNKEAELVKHLEGFFMRSKNYRDQRLGQKDRWQSYRSWFLNTGGNYEGERSMTYVNMIFEKIEKLTADLAEGKPAFTFEPNTPEDILMTDVLNHAVPWVWESQHLQAVYYRTVKAACLYGTWYWKVIHDPGFSNTGSIERVREVPCWYLFPAPYACDMDTAPWVIEVMPRTIGEIENDYGVSVRADITLNEVFPSIEEDLGDKSGRPQWVQTAGGPGGSPAGGDMVEGLPDTFMANSPRADIVLQKELWIRDGMLLEDFNFVEELEGGPKLIKSYALKYPRGRVISWAGNRILYDRENPYQDGRFPYVTFKDISVPDFWYGLGEVEHLIPLQLLHDDTHEIIKQIHLFTATGRLVVDESTGLREDMIGNSPGEIWFTRPGTSDKVRWMSGAAPNQEFYVYLQHLQAAADLVTGREDVTRGLVPGEVRSGRAIMTLQQAAAARVKGRQNDLEDALARFAHLVGSRIQQFWPEETVYRVTGKKKAGTPEFHRAFLTPTERAATYTARVSASANLDAAREAEFQKLMLLAQLGVPIDPESLIEAANVSSSTKILARMAQAATTPPPPATAAPQGGESKNVIPINQAAGRGAEAR